jgi:hypothetical protein
MLVANILIFKNICTIYSTHVLSRFCALPFMAPCAVSGTMVQRSREGRGVGGGEGGGEEEEEEEEAPLVLMTRWAVERYTPLVQRSSMSPRLMMSAPAFGGTCVCTYTHTHMCVCM